ncbi:MAG: glycosyltransferase family 2 protein [Acidobacteria bacterium]|nr:glycosyltransferase family 2 protein [Acidobacteriota bacterium]
MPVTAIIPTWNQRELVLQVIADLQAQTQPPPVICVIDNGSTDRTAEACHDRGANVISMGRNAGFAAAVNRGIAEASTEWVAILNNDVRLQPHWLSQLLGRAQRENADFAAGKLLRQNDPSQLDGCFDLLSRGGCAWRAGESRPDSALWNQARPIQFVPFTAALLRRGLFTEIGLLDETFESYLEDVEFGVRCALAGKRGIYVPEAVAQHAGSATLGPWSPRMVRLIARNQILLMAKHGALAGNRWPAFVSQALWGLLALRHGAAAAWFQGKREGFAMARRHSGAAPPGLAAILRESEGEIHALQKQTGFDTFWRIYFALT